MFAAMKREQHLDEILGDYLAAADAGQARDRRELLAGHPDLETELTEFFTELDRLDRLTAPIRPAQPPDLYSLLDLDAPLPPFPGDYELLEVLGQGGMGVVYKARDTKLDRLVALKMIRAGWLATREHVRRFQNEARTAAKLDHPHIMPIHEVGEVNGQPFYTMKLVEGRNLSERLEDFRLPLADSKMNNKGWPGLRYSEGWPGLRYSLRFYRNLPVKFTRF
jgi:serine/threonine-protein kinase